MIVLRLQGAPDLVLEDGQARALADALWGDQPGRGAVTLAALLTNELRRGEHLRAGIDLDARQTAIVGQVLRVMAG